MATRAVRNQERHRLFYLWKLANTLQPTSPLLASHCGSTLTHSDIGNTALRFHCKHCGGLLNLAQVRVRANNTKKKKEKNKKDRKGTRNGPKNWVVTTCSACGKSQTERGSGQANATEKYPCPSIKEEQSDNIVSTKRNRSKTGVKNDSDGTKGKKKKRRKTMPENTTLDGRKAKKRGGQKAVLERANEEFANSFLFRSLQKK